jgi:hypothetical protein
MSTKFLPVIARKKAGGAGGDTWTANNAVLSAQDAALKAYWKMEDTSDSIGSNTLVNTNGVTFTAGKRDDAATSVAASSQWLGAPYSADFHPGSSNFAVSFWANFDDVASDNATVFGPTLDLDRSWMIFSNADEFFFYASTDGATWDLVSALSFGSIPDQVYTHFALIRVGNNWRTYRNGSLVNSVTAAGTVFDNGHQLYFFTNQGASKRYTEGQFDEVPIWKGHTLADATDANTFAGDSGLYNSVTGAFLI